MQIGKIEVGNTLVCCQCEHERLVEAAWIETVCRRFFRGRTPPRIYDTDLARFRCSECQSKSLLKRIQASALIPGVGASKPIAGHHLATAYLEQASREERAALLLWATGLITIRDANVPALEKAKGAIRLTVQSGTILPFLKFLGSEIKRVGWNQRGLPERLALSAAAVTALVFSGQGAGIAALGGAIGVPLWVVFGAGGAFAGVLIDEAKRRIERSDDDATTKPSPETVTPKCLDRDD